MIKRWHKFLNILIFFLLTIIPSLCYSDTTFTDVSVEAGVAYTPMMTWGCSFADINNDGYIDIFIPNHYMNDPYLYLNNGNGTFSEVGSDYGLKREDFNIRPNTSDGNFIGNTWGDFDNDGDVDLYIACGTVATVGSNHLMRNDGSIFVEITDEAGVADELGRGRTPLWCDYNRDGDLDLFVTNATRENSPSRLFRNNGAGTFTDVTQSAGLFDTLNNKHFEAAVWGDYDKDGDMDLFLTTTYCGPPVLFRNNGDGTFTDVTSEAGLIKSMDDYNVAWGNGITLGDYDNDSDLDLFITQGTDNHGVIWDEDSIEYYTVCNETDEKLVNFKTTGDQVTFDLEGYGLDQNPEWVFIGKEGFHPPSVPFTLQEGEAYGRPENPADVIYLVWQDSDDKEWHISMKRSVTWPDITDNRTGIITSNGSFSDVTSSNMGNPYNTYKSFLFSNNGDGTFTDVTYEAGLGAQGLSSSAVWADFDNDGYLDLYIVNFNTFENAPNWLYHNNGNGTFTEVASSWNVTGMVAGRGDVGIVGDYNNDGFMDIFITNGRTLGLFGQGPYILYKNNGNSNNWLEIKTIGTVSNRDGIGAKVKVTTGDVTQYREQNGGTTLYGQNSTILHVGLGSASTIDRLEVEWPSGKSQEFTNLPVNQILTLIEPGVTSWGDVISAYNDYVSGKKTWQDVIATYQAYVAGQT